GRSSKKLQLEPLLKSADRVAQGRLRHTDLCRSPRKAPFSGDDCKRSRFVQQGRLEATFCRFRPETKLSSHAQFLPVPNVMDNRPMDTDVRALRSLAQTYFDSAYEMDADKFASIFHPSSSVTKVGDDGNVSVTPIATWLAAVRNLKAPKQQG